MFKRRLAGLCLLALLALGLTGCGSEPTAEPTPAATAVATAMRTEQLPGKLALVRAGAIWVWQDRQLRQIIPPPVTQPVFAPDGNSIAYIERSAGAADLVIADSDGARLFPLTDNGSSLPTTSLERVYETAWAWYPAFAPAGDRLVVALQARPPAGDPPIDRALSLFEIGLSGQRRPLTDGDGIDYGRAVIASSGAIYVAGVTREKDAQQTLYVIDSAGLRTPIAGAPIPAYDPTLSRDERYLVFAATVDGTTDLYGLDLLSGSATATRLTELGSARAPAVSPDGRQLAFLAIAPDGATFDLFVADFGVDAAGVLRSGEPRRLSTDLGLDPDGGLSWAP